MKNQSKTDTQFDIECYQKMTGLEVSKKSRKPFKSGLHINTVTGLEMNYITNRISFSFAEDVSIVECFRCDLVSSSHII